MRVPNFVILFALVYSAVAVAEVYRWKDDEGNVIYSDVPQPGAEKVEVSEPTIVPSNPAGSVTSKPAAQGQPAAKAYESVTVTSPPDEQTIRDNVANINVAVSVLPALQAEHGHTLQLVFDGQEVGEPGRANSFTLPNVDRGAHTLQVIILDARGRVFARSPISTFFVHKHSVQRRAP